MASCGTGMYSPNINTKLFEPPLSPNKYWIPFLERIGVTKMPGKMSHTRPGPADTSYSTRIGGVKSSFVLIDEGATPLPSLTPDSGGISATPAT